MTKRVNSKVMTSDEHSAQVLRAIMFVVFNDYLELATVEEFQERWGTNGIEYLDRWTE